jgi:Cu/Ag efflux protein CusF
MSMKTTKIQTAWVAAVCATLGIAGCAAMCKEAPPPPAAVAPAPLPSGVVGENLVSATARVKAIDHKTRRVTLQRADGSVVKFVAGDEVRNLPQVKVGDEVNVTYYESLAYEVRKPGEGAPGAGASIAEGAARAKLGEKPGGAAGRVTTVTATIAAIDKGAGTVTLRGPDGETTTIKARNPDNLNRVAVGDLVDITYTEALAISVETPQKK